MEQLNRRDLIHYLLLAASDIRERESEIERIHGQAGLREEASAEEIRSLAAQVFHANRHLSNAFVMLARRLEGEEAAERAASATRQRRFRLRLYARVQKAAAAFLNA